MNAYRSALIAIAPALALGAWLAPTPRDREQAPEPVAQVPETTAALRVRYLEIVTPDRDATCELLEQVHGLSFGEPVPELGNARCAPLEGGGRLGVRAPMHEAEEPVVRPYLGVEDLDAAVAVAAASGAEIALPPTAAGGNRFAIYFHGGIQHGLWKP